MKKTLLLTLVLGWVTSTLPAQTYERYKTLTDTTIASAHLGFGKQLTVTVPLEWQEDIDRRFPLIVIFDSQNKRSHGYMLRTIDYLTSNEQMPASVIVSVASTREYRYYETAYKASDVEGLAEENERFLVEELIPLAEAQYMAALFRVVVGHSRYGYFTSALLFSQPDALNGIISLSPFFAQKNVSLADSVAGLNQKSFPSTKYYRFGIGNEYPEEFHAMEAALRTLNNPTIDAKGVLFEEADHNVTPGLTIGVALYEIFEAWAGIQRQYITSGDNSVASLIEMNEAVVAHYGSELAFALGILNGKGWEFYNNARYVDAIAAWEIMMEAYPNFSEGYLYMLDARMQLGHPEAYEMLIKRFYDSIAGSAFYSEEEKQELISEMEAALD